MSMNKRTDHPFCSKNSLYYICLSFLIILTLTGCGGSSGIQNQTKVEQAAQDKMAAQLGSIPEQNAPGENTIGNDSVRFDITNVANGYYQIHYQGQNDKVKLQVTGPDGITYTYNIQTDPIYLPISSGSGSYSVAVFEHISDQQYATAFKGDFQVELANDFYPFLYSNLYVDYKDASQVTSLASSLCKEATCDLEAIDLVYQYVIDNIAYDEEKAKTVAFDYIPNISEILTTKKGICFDYASLMAGMLRSQSIPTRLQIGYAGEAYHAWISTYIQDVGWIDGIIQFDGQKWSLMDPTFAANGKNSSSVKKFIGDGSNYQTLYTY